MSHENKELTERERLQIKLGQLPADLCPMQIGKRKSHILSAWAGNVSA